MLDVRAVLDVDLVPRVRVYLGFWVEGYGSRVRGLWIRGFGSWCSGFRLQGLECERVRVYLAQHLGLSKKATLGRSVRDPGSLSRANGTAAHSSVPALAFASK